MIKFLNLILLIFSLVFTVQAQKISYKFKTNIPYYSDSVNSVDPTIREQCMLDVYYPVNKKDFATIIWFHGGGLTGGAKEIPDGLKEKEIAIIGVNYRLYPTVKAPGYIDDATAAVAWVFKNIDQFGGNPSLIFVSGHSAGGYLTLMLGLDKHYLKSYEIDANHIAGLIPLSGQCITHFTVRKEMGIPDKQPLINELAPLYFVRADAPPILLITGDRELEMLGRYEENAYLARMMKVNGNTTTRLIEIGGYGHSMVEPALPLLIEEVKRICELKLKEMN